MAIDWTGVWPLYLRLWPNWKCHVTAAPPVFTTPFTTAVVVVSAVAPLSEGISPSKGNGTAAGCLIASKSWFIFIMHAFPG